MTRARAQKEGPDLALLPRTWYQHITDAIAASAADGDGGGGGGGGGGGRAAAADGAYTRPCSSA